MNQQSVLQYMTGRLEESAGRPVQNDEIDFRVCYQMVTKLEGKQVCKGDDGDYLYKQDDLIRAYALVTK